MHWSWRTFTVVWFVIAPVSVVGASCAARPSVGPPPQPIAIPTQPEQEATSLPPERMEGPVAIEPSVVVVGDAGEPPLPISWAVTFGHTRPFSEALRIARSSRASFDATAAQLGVDGGTPAATQFERANALLEQTSRRFAAAFHAPDTTPANKLDALREASEMLVGWSLRLDQSNLRDAPVAYRSNPGVALTFEDVASGPVRRWHQEALALLQLCIESARANHLETSSSARECVRLRKENARVRTRLRPDAGMSTGCACDFGDPLCSASMSGWCRP
jgi:hypothetical protein